MLTPVTSSEKFKVTTPADTDLGSGVVATNDAVGRAPGMLPPEVPAPAPPDSTDVGPLTEPPLETVPLPAPVLLPLETLEPPGGAAGASIDSS